MTLGYYEFYIFLFLFYFIFSDVVLLNVCPGMGLDPCFLSIVMSIDILYSCICGIWSFVFFYVQQLFVVGFFMLIFSDLLSFFCLAIFFILIVICLCSHVLVFNSPCHIFVFSSALSPRCLHSAPITPLCVYSHCLPLFFARLSSTLCNFMYVKLNFTYFT